MNLTKWFTDLFTIPVVNTPTKKVDNEIKLTKEEMVTLVQQIHDDFYGTQDELIKYSNDIVLLTDEQQEFTNKIERLRELGFKNVELDNPLIKELSNINDTNKEKTHLAKVIHYFNDKYPSYKFITQEGVNSLLKKYNLVISDCDEYKGQVPLENIEHLEKFKIDDIDCLYQLSFTRYYVSYYTTSSEHHITGSEKYLIEMEQNNYPTNENTKNILKKLNKVPLQVIATPCDFVGMVTTLDFQSINIPDPIVLQPVVYENKPYYLIVTAWSNI